MTHVAIVGGGASGVLAAIALGRRGEVTVFEPRDRLGHGYAYATTRSEHLLNVPAGRLGADEGAVGDFVTWCRQRGEDVDHATFARRASYGEYLSTCVTGRVAHDRGRVVDLERVGLRWAVVTADGRRTLADDVVLATGYGPSPGARALAGVETPLLVRDPYRPDAYDPIPDRGPIVVVGTGLTAIDVVTTLADDRPEQPLIAVSRRGWVPTIHDLAVDPVDVDVTAVTARGLVRQLREAAARAGGDGGDWRAVVDGMRARTPSVWRALPYAERARFLRHGRRAWDVHRHRLAPEVATAVAALVETGRLEIRRGTPAVRRATHDRIELSVTERPSGRRTAIAAAGAVLCTGVVDGDWRAADPLLAGLERSRLVRADPLGIGPEIDDVGRFVRADGTPARRLWAIGPLRRAAEWETTAIPEIRRQATELASRVTA